MKAIYFFVVVILLVNIKSNNALCGGCGCNVFGCNCQLTPQECKTKLFPPEPIISGRLGIEIEKKISPNARIINSNIEDFSLEKFIDWKKRRGVAQN